METKANQAQKEGEIMNTQFRDCLKCRFRFVAIGGAIECRHCGTTATEEAHPDREVAVRKLAKIDGEWVQTIIYRKAPLS